MYWLIYIVAVIIFLAIPIPLQILILIVDFFVTGLGIDEVLMVVGIWLKIKMKKTI